MKINTYNFYHLFNSVKKINDVKLYFWYTVNNFSYLLGQIMRLLNY